MAVWNRFQSLIFGGAIGAAARTAIEPQIEPARQLAWANNRNRILDPGTLASLVAQGITDEGSAADEAHRSGYDDNKLAALIQLALTVPDLGALDEMLNRETIKPADFKHALAKMQIEPEYWDALIERTNDKLSPADIANAIQQSFMPDPGFIPGAPAGGPPYNITAETVNIPPLEELKASGLDRDQLHVLTQLSGNPPGPQELLQMWNRHVITEDSVDAGIREGRTKTKWIPAIKELRHHILSPVDAAGLRLRGWITAEKSYELGALSGASKETMDELFLNRGRPATPRQIHLGYARGAKYLGENLTEAEAIARGVKQSDIRPEWEAIEAQNVWSYPSPFVLRSLAQSGALTQAQVHQILLEEGWKPEYATATAAFWAKGTTAKQQGETQSELADEYMVGFITETEYRAALTGLGLTGHEQDLEVLHAEVSAIKTARGAQVTKLRNAYDKGEITQAIFAGSLAALGMHDVAVQREVEYANVYRNAVGITG